jgi:hypothetical protein
MKKSQFFLFISKAAKFSLCLLILDLGAGEAHRYLFFRQETGKFFRINYTMDLVTEDLVVFGSSHAAAHYVPDVLEQELGLSSYNAGVAGQQILVHQALQEIMLERLSPRMIILDIDTFALFHNQFQYDRLSDLYPFYYKHPKILGRILDLKSKFIRLFLNSKLFQYNSTIVHVIRYWLAPQKDNKGYRPNFAKLATPPESAKLCMESTAPATRRNRPLDKNLVGALEEFIMNSLKKDIRLVLVISPNLEHVDLSDNESVIRTKSLTEEYGVKMLNFANAPEFLGNYEFFANSGHLNDRGARVFSKMVADSIKQKIGGLQD